MKNTFIKFLLFGVVTLLAFYFTACPRGDECECSDPCVILNCSCIDCPGDGIVDCECNDPCIILNCSCIDCPGTGSDTYINYLAITDTDLNLMESNPNYIGFGIFPSTLTDEDVIEDFFLLLNGEIPLLVIAGCDNETDDGEALFVYEDIIVMPLYEIDGNNWTETGSFHVWVVCSDDNDNYIILRSKDPVNFVYNITSVINAQTDFDVIDSKGRFIVFASYYNEKLTPAADDFIIGNINQITNNVTAVTITPKDDKSTGTIQIQYNTHGDTWNNTVPQGIGEYPIRFDVGQAEGWNAVFGLDGGILTVNPLPPIEEWTLVQETFNQRVGGTRAANIEGIAYGNGMYVIGGLYSYGGAGGATFGFMCYSSDLENWTEISIPSTSSIDYVTFENGMFIVKGQNIYLYSDDGITWESHNNSNSITSIAYGNGIYVAGRWYSQISYSSDGITWTAVDDPDVRELFWDRSQYYWGQLNHYYWQSDIHFFNGKFYTVGGVNRSLYSSLNGINWTVEYDTLLEEISNVDNFTIINDKFFVFYDDEIAFSSDGINWTVVNITIFGLDSDTSVYSEITSITYGNGMYYAVGTNRKMAYSQDAVNWTALSNNPFKGVQSNERYDIYKIIYADGKFITFGNRRGNFLDAGFGFVGRIAYCEY